MTASDSADGPHRQPGHPTDQGGQSDPVVVPATRWFGSGDLHVHGDQPRRRAAEPPGRATCRDRAERDRPGLGRRPQLRPADHLHRWRCQRQPAPRPRRGVDLHLHQPGVGQRRPPGPERRAHHRTAVWRRWSQPPPIDPVNDVAIAVVRVLTPGIDVVKTALRPTVLDPDAPAIAGPGRPDAAAGAVHLRRVQHRDGVPGPDSRSPDRRHLLAAGPRHPVGRRQRQRTPRSRRGVALHLRDHSLPGGRERLGRRGQHGDRDRQPDVDGTRFPDLPVTDTTTPPSTSSSRGCRSPRQRPRPRCKRRPRRDLHVRGPEHRRRGTVQRRPGRRQVRARSPSPVATTTTTTCSTAPTREPRSAGPTPVPGRCPATAPDTVDTNRVTVTASDPLNNTYRDVDTARVTVLQPAIHLEKSVSKSLVPAGSPR